MVSADRQTRRLLLLGFGGLLVLLAFTGLNALSVLRRIETRSETIREDYFKRDQVLEQLRSDIYLSGTYARDLLLEQDTTRADIHRQELQELRERVKSNVGVYDGVLRGEERGPFREFAKEVRVVLRLSPARARMECRATSGFRLHIHEGLSAAAAHDCCPARGPNWRG